jgi:hypothetical protein
MSTLPLVSGLPSGPSGCLASNPLGGLMVPTSNLSLQAAAPTSDRTTAMHEQGLVCFMFLG